MKQQSLAAMRDQAKKKQTRPEHFFAEMEQVVPWADLVALVAPHYSTSGRRGRPPMPLQSMLRSYFMQPWYAMRAPAMEDARYAIESMRRFAGLDLSEDSIPDETTILQFRRLLEHYDLSTMN